MRGTVTAKVKIAHQLARVDGTRQGLSFDRAHVDTHLDCAHPSCTPLAYAYMAQAAILPKFPALAGLSEEVQLPSQKTQASESEPSFSTSLLALADDGFGACSQKFP